MIFNLITEPHLAKASFPQHRKEGEVREFDLVHDVGRQLVGVAVKLRNRLLPRAELGFLRSGHKMEVYERHCVIFYISMLINVHSRVSTTQKKIQSVFLFSINTTFYVYAILE